MTTPITNPIEPAVKSRVDRYRHELAWIPGVQLEYLPPNRHRGALLAFTLSETGERLVVPSQYLYDSYLYGAAVADQLLGMPVAAVSLPGAVIFVPRSYVIEGGSTCESASGNSNS